MIDVRSTKTNLAQMAVQLDLDALIRRRRALVDLRDPDTEVSDRGDRFYRRSLHMVTAANLMRLAAKELQDA